MKEFTLATNYFFSILFAQRETRRQTTEQDRRPDRQRFRRESSLVEA